MAIDNFRERFEHNRRSINRLWWVALIGSLLMLGAFAVIIVVGILAAVKWLT